MQLPLADVWCAIVRCICGAQIRPTCERLLWKALTTCCRNHTIKSAQVGFYFQLDLCFFVFTFLFLLAIHFLLFLIHIVFLKKNVLEG